MIAMALRRGATSKIGKARFGKCHLAITPPEFIKGVRERRIFRKKKLAGEDPPDPPNLVRECRETKTTKKNKTKKPWRWDLIHLLMFDNVNRLLSQKK
jgi:hypothetical protein